MWWVPWAKKSLESKVCHAHMVKDGMWGKNSMVCRSEFGTAPSSSHNCAWVLRKEDNVRTNWRNEWIPGREDLGITRSLVLVMEETMNHRMGQSGNFLSAWNISGLRHLGCGGWGTTLAALGLASGALRGSHLLVAGLMADLRWLQRQLIWRRSAALTENLKCVTSEDAKRNWEEEL